MRAVPQRHERASKWLTVDHALNLNQPASSEEFHRFRPNYVRPSTLLRTLLAMISRMGREEIDSLLSNACGGAARNSRPCSEDESIYSPAGYHRAAPIANAPNVAGFCGLVLPSAGGVSNTPARIGLLGTVRLAFAVATCVSRSPSNLRDSRIIWRVFMVDSKPRRCIIAPLVLTALLAPD
jgi:hypothetical protein